MLAILHSVGMFVADDIQIWKGSNCFLTVADAVFYIQQGKIKLTVVSEKARKRSLQSSDLVWRGMSEWPSAAHRNNEGDG